MQGGMQAVNAAHGSTTGDQVLRVVQRALGFAEDGLSTPPLARSLGSQA